MLRYLNIGVRNFGRWPLGAFNRPNWEFYAVLKGPCGVVLPGGRELPFKKCNLWVFPPFHTHGWHGDPDNPCEIVALHFNKVPHVLESMLKDKQACLERKLDKHACDRIKEMAQSLEADYNRPTQLSQVRAERVLLDLTLMILEDAPASALPTVEQKAEEKVDTAIAWFKSHLSEGPSVAEVAEAVHVSPTHLRRLFAKVRDDSPRSLFNQIRLEAASHLLAETSEKLDFIAAQCGYSSASNLARDFKAYRGLSPSQWRKRTTDYARILEAFRKETESNKFTDNS